jgi:hypothetical protein
MFIEKENQMTKRNKYSTEFKQTVCEYYSNHIWRDTAVHFGMPEDYNTSQLCTRWYKELGFLPKSAGRNPNMSRVKPSASKKRANAGLLVRSGCFIFNGKVMGKTEWVQLNEKGVINAEDTFYTVEQHKVGVTIKRNPIAKLFSRFI